MKGNNLYKYFNRHRGYMRRLMDEHAIDKAIRKAIGVRQFDKSIRKIWDRVLIRPTRKGGKETTPDSGICKTCNFLAEDVRKLHNDHAIYIKKAVVIDLDKLSGSFENR